MGPWATANCCRAGIKSLRGTGLVQNLTGTKQSEQIRPKPGKIEEETKWFSPNRIETKRANLKLCEIQAMRLFVEAVRVTLEAVRMLLEAVRVIIKAIR